MKSEKLAAAFGASALLLGCGDEPFALRDGCYYAENGRPILKVGGEEGIILTPAPQPNISGYTYTPVRRVRLSARVGRDGAYLEVSPGFYLTDADEAATSSPSSRFTVNAHSTSPVIMVNMEAHGEKPVSLGPPC